MSQRGRGWLLWVLPVVGLAVGVILALISPWRLCLVGKERPETAVLLEYLREQYMVAVSDLYASNGDLEQAQERLAPLGEEDLASAVVEVTKRRMERGEDVETTRALIALAQALGSEDEAMSEYLVATAPTSTPTETAIPTPTATESPSPTATPTSTPTRADTPSPAPPSAPTPTTGPAPPGPVAREWDRRLDWFYPTVRMEETPINSGQWYWRLTRTRWEEECGGRHHIYVEVLDENGNRSFGESVVVEYGSVPHLFPYPDLEKLGEDYAFNYPMNELLGAYNVYVEGLPSDKMLGMGLGMRVDPYRKHHTCFFLTFRRTYQP